MGEEEVRRRALGAFDRREVAHREAVPVRSFCESAGLAYDGAGGEVPDADGSVGVCGPQVS